MKRDLYQQLQHWEASKHRKPLVLRGARQVGKTHLLKQFGQQELVAAQHRPHYWASGNQAEVNFIVEHDASIYPLEVKSSISRRKKSLLVYDDKYHPKCLLRASLMNLRRDGNMCNFPLYLISRLAELFK